MSPAVPAGSCSIKVIIAYADNHVYAVVMRCSDDAATASCRRSLLGSGSGGRTWTQRNVTVALRILAAAGPDALVGIRNGTGRGPAHPCWASPCSAGTGWGRQARLR
jgi:hypothetical protein